MRNPRRAKSFLRGDSGISEEGHYAKEGRGTERERESRTTALSLALSQPHILGAFIPEEKVSTSQFYAKLKR
jgi:hypothetical protein